MGLRRLQAALLYYYFGTPPHESRGLKSTPRHRLWTVLRGFFVDRFAVGTIPEISREQKSWRAGSDAVAVE